MFLFDLFIGSCHLRMYKSRKDSNFDASVRKCSIQSLRLKRITGDDKKKDL